MGLLAGAVVVGFWFVADGGKPSVGVDGGGARERDDAAKRKPAWVAGSGESPPSVEPGDSGAAPAEVAPAGDAIERVDEVERRTIRVRVVDRGGRPVEGVPVALLLVQARDDARKPRALARSDRDGFARLADYVEEVRQSRDMHQSRWCVGFPFPEAEPQTVAVDPLQPPQETIELVAPELGKLTVRVVDGAGRPVEARGELRVFAWALGSEERLALRAEPFAYSLSSGGGLVIDPIAIGLRVRIDAELAEYGAESVEADGPGRAGESAELELKLPRHGPIVVGELVGSDGVPLRSLRLAGVVHDDPVARAQAGDTVVETGADGRFRFDASKYELEDESLPRYLDLLAESRGSGIIGRARVVLPVPLLAAEHQVGRVQFETAPLVLSGRVVDDKGFGIGEARVCVCRGSAAVIEGLRTAGSGDVLYGRTDGKGAFEVRGFLGNEERVVFAVDSKKRESAPLRFEPGATGVTLVVKGRGWLAGSLILDPSIDSIHVGVFVRRGGGPFELRVAPAPDGSFDCGQVVAGKVDVAVGIGRYSDRPEIVLVVPDVEVKADVKADDPRLERIDLRDQVPRARVEVVDPGGRPLQGGSVTLLGDDEARSSVLTVLIRNGVVELPTKRAVFDVEVRARGLRTERRLGLTSPARIEMKAGLEVDFALEPPLSEADLSGAVTLLLSIRPDDESSGAGQQRIELDAAGTGRAILSEPGRVRVEIEASCELPFGDEPPERLKRWSALSEQLGQAFGKPTVEIREEGATARVPLPAAARQILVQMGREFSGK